jgi:cephalosporin hydroxylase
MTDREIIDEFHKLFYDSTLKTWASTFWLGVSVEKFPCDLWVYQEIIQETRPDFIVETGTRFGGSSLYMASICELLGRGHVLTVDVSDLASSPEVRPAHPRITYLIGSSTSTEIVSAIKERVADARVMVVLDSDHTMTHVIDEMRIYADIVTEGCYLIVEDTNINGNPVAPSFGHGPMEAVDLFLAGNREFFIDRSREKFLITFNPRGFLKKGLEGEVEASLRVEEEELQKDASEQLAKAEELLLAKDQIIDDLTRQLTTVESDFSQIETVYRSMTKSISWRLTAPLRWAGRVRGKPE